MLKRVSLALATGAAPMPSVGRIAVFDPPEPPSFLDLPADRIEVISSSARLHAACAAVGISAKTTTSGPYAAALVFLDRSRPAMRLRLAQAVAAVPEFAPVLVDGQKSDGIEVALKECRERVEISDSYVKAHGRLFWFEAAPVFGDWAEIEANWPTVDGYQTAPGVFSADGVDPGSALLAKTLPPLKGSGADLGAGWGFLASSILAHDGIAALSLVEEDHRALEAARANVADPRASFHWNDATQWTPSAPLDFVVSNPPFHVGRTASPDLGRAFIAAAAGMLARHGTLWMVANRHLPYEAALDAHFGSVSERLAHSGYKIIEATAPKVGRDARRRA